MTLMALSTVSNLTPFTLCLIRNGKDREDSIYSMLPDEAGQDGSELFIRAAEDGVDIH